MLPLACIQLVGRSATAHKKEKKWREELGMEGRIPAVNAVFPLSARAKY